MLYITRLSAILVACLSLLWITPAAAEGLALRSPASRFLNAREPDHSLNQ